MSTTSIGDSPSSCRIFALIVGIDKYAAKTNHLRGCVNDAISVRDFLRDCLHVPDDRMVVLLDHSATRDKIISKFRTHLTQNDNIRSKGDALIFFFAGHGSRTEAPPDWPVVGGQIETICPYDDGKQVSETEYVHGISDLTIIALVRELAAEKGDNITLIMDSCHSGGIARNDPEILAANTRYSETSNPISANLDRELWDSAERLASVSGFNIQDTRVLLAACRQEQQARESSYEAGIWRGFFTYNLIKKLRSATLADLTYSKLIDMLPVGIYLDQHPQCEGTHQNRFLFDGKAPLTNSKILDLKEEKGTYTVPWGAIHGVVAGMRGTKFAVLENDTPRSPPCLLWASLVEPMRSTLRMESGEQLSFAPGTQVMVVDWMNTARMLKVALSPGSPPLLSDALFPSGGRGSDQLITPGRAYTCATSMEYADICVEYDQTGVLVITRLDEKMRVLTRVQRFPFELDSQGLAMLPDAFDAIAHFNFFLGLNYVHDNLRNNVTLEMCRVLGHSGSRSRDGAVDLLETGKVTLKENMKYGFAICSSFDKALFAYLFYFDPVDYSISVWHSPPAKQGSGMLPPYRSGQREPHRLPVGYADGGAPIQFTVPRGQTSDTGFVKLVVCTEYVDLRWITQGPQFKHEPARLKLIREDPRRGIWGAWDFPLTVEL